MTERTAMPRDPNQRAKAIVDLSTHQVEPKPTRAKDPLAVALGRRGGLVGGKARAAKMTPEQRRESARRAALARWRNRTAE